MLGSTLGLTEGFDEGTTLGETLGVTDGADEGVTVGTEEG